LNEAAIQLRGLGRLEEAVTPMRAACEKSVQQKRWYAAASSTNNLSELKLTLGEVGEAVRVAWRSVNLADRSDDLGLKIICRTTLADALHQAGDQTAALDYFRESEIRQSDLHPKFPLLYSQQGFQYCDLLLVQAEQAAKRGQDHDVSARLQECEEVQRRALHTLSVAENQSNFGPFEIGLDSLTLSRLKLYQAILGNRASTSLSDARIKVEEAVSALRAGGRTDQIPGGLLTRAWVRVVTGDLTGAREDLDEAHEIAERGSMKLHLADVALCRAHLFSDREALAEAKSLVEDCGYGRRRPEIEDLEQMLAKGL
jgi:hypothetical protein